MNFVEKIRLLADFFEAHPALETPIIPDLVCTYSKEQMLLAAKIDGAVKEYDTDYLYVVVPISENLKMRFFTSRNTVCEPVETEDVLIPALPAKTIKKVIKWKCHPLLEATGKESPEGEESPF